jgi:hypothetical protein
MTVVRGSMAMTEVYIGMMPSKKGLLGLLFEETSKRNKRKAKNRYPSKPRVRHPAGVKPGFTV